MSMLEKYLLAIIISLIYICVNTNGTFKLYSLEWVLFFTLTTIIYWCIITKILTKENYSPYKNTGDCTLNNGGYKYLDVYDEQQFYLNNPRVYPTSDNFFKSLVKNKKQEEEFVRQQRMDIEKLYSNLN